MAEIDRQRKRQLPARSLRFDAAQIAMACNAFYQPILLAENRLLRERGFLNEQRDKDIDRLLNALRDSMEHGEVFLLRLGRHSGMESLTLNGVRHIKIMEGKGPDGKKRYSEAETAKTLWLAANTKDQNTGLLPFGWVLVELLPLNAAVTERPEVRTACDPYLAKARNFFNKLEAQHMRIAESREQAEARRQQEEERRRKAEEEEAKRTREEKERQTRLATMSANMRRVESFKEEMAARAEQLCGRKDKPNTLYHDKARQLVRDALEGSDWNAEEKRALAEAIEEWLPKVIVVDMKGERKN